MKEIIGRIIPSGYVVFDFDNQPYIDIISKLVDEFHLKCEKLTTTRGAHYLFKTNLSKIKDESHRFNWIGIELDVKGSGVEENKQSYQAIKVNGQVRKREFINCSSYDELDIAPKWLYPVSKKKDDIDLTIDQKGNRNNMFHRSTYDKS